MMENHEQMEVENKKNNAGKIILVIIILLLLISFTVGVSYHFFSKMDVGGGDHEVITNDEISVFYLTGQDIQVEGMMPGYEKDAPRHTFSLENNGKSSQKYTISFVNVELQQAGRDISSANLKWSLYEANSSYSEQKELAIGDFSVLESTLPILENITIAPGEKQYYVLKIWLEEINEAQNEDQGLDFSAQVGIGLVK